MSGTVNLLSERQIARCNRDDLADLVRQQQGVISRVFTVIRESNDLALQLKATDAALGRDVA